MLSLLVAATLSPGAAAIADPGEVLWRFEIPSNVPGAYVATGADGTVYFTDNLRMYALTPDGEPIWTSPVGTGGDKPIVIGADGTLYTANSLIYAIDPADGSLMWEYSTGSNNAILAGPGIGPDDNIYAVQGTINEGVGFFSLDEEGQAQWTVSGDPAPQGSAATMRRLHFPATGSLPDSRTTPDNSLASGPSNWTVISTGTPAGTACSFPQARHPSWRRTVTSSCVGPRASSLQ